MTIQPNCFLIGAMKAGTTALASALSVHSQIILPSLKEPQFFTVKAFFNEKKIDIASYQRLYELATHTAIDASTWYLYDPDSARLIYEFNPSAKIIAVLRHPADRAFSHWQYLSRDGRCPHKTFDDAINQELQLISEGISINPYPYLGMGKYGIGLKRFYDYFPRDQVRIYIYDDIVTNSRAVLDDIQAFLGVSHELVQLESNVNSSGIPSSKHIHRLFNTPSLLRKAAKTLLPSKEIRKKVIHLVNKTNLQKQQLSIDQRRFLNTFFEDDILATESLLGISLSQWRVS
jgi:hypothetical protein